MRNAPGAKPEIASTGSSEPSYSMKRRLNSPVGTRHASILPNTRYLRRSGRVGVRKHARAVLWARAVAGDDARHAYTASLHAPVLCDELVECIADRARQDVAGGQCPVRPVHQGERAEDRLSVDVVLVAWAARVTGEQRWPAKAQWAKRIRAAVRAAPRRQSNTCKPQALQRGPACSASNEEPAANRRTAVVHASWNARTAPAAGGPIRNALRKAPCALWDSVWGSGRDTRQQQKAQCDSR